MMEHYLPLALAAIGMVAGFATVVLGVAQLTCEHAESRWTPRFSTAGLAAVAGWVAVDCWNALSGVGEADDKAVALVVILAVSWAHRRAYGLTTGNRPARAARAADFEA